MTEGPTAIELLRGVVAPVGTAYVVVLALLWQFGRARRAGTAAPQTPNPRRAGAVTSWPALLRHVLSTVAGGYLLFLLIVGVFYFVLGDHDERFLLQALREGSVLTFAIVVPAFLLISWLYERPGGPRRSREEVHS